MSKLAWNQSAKASRHFVFLQGMPSAFFRLVGDALEKSSHRVSRINFCAGDWLFWHDRRALSYRGTLADWPNFFGQWLHDAHATDVVLLGEQRKYHREAVQVAKAAGVRVWATDFGYLRPDWITLEANGLGGNSTMPRDLAEIERLAANLPPVDFQRKYHDSSWRMSLGDLAASFATVFFSVFYPRYQQSDARPHPLIYFPAMGLSLLVKAWQQKPALRLFAHINRRGRAYFVFPLQLNHDFQIQAYSPFAGMGDAISLVLASFARHAPIECDLLIKSHPWDPGLHNWNKQIQKEARQLGIAERVFYFNGGDLNAMMRKARGVVTVNSTSGLQALQMGRAVKVLGACVYDVPELVDTQSLDDFWQNPTPPDATQLADFIRLLVQQTQIRGVFFGRADGSPSVINFAQRLTEPSHLTQELINHA
ncbi:capsule biosynthesis protein [Halothiobacillus neapolitanus]|uniref:Capsule polysaccharide biosynthesis protein n=1 Tax=Halothiobacillus neapolitanus (strain ATCC 23641 / DSM 15147 / CIP 104769 / NCIMB 8539 / c2) TaxID=555778 RepID=D0L0U2_HALNC|nr:capsular biosynthesis protein [Halothiobacillus neapolitanus]ACX96315.1 Capsule polysaccharide biosynthesis protein [Halothiobacillus neapolitanus c2]TDN66627.1 capsular polysaccharide export protein [Halothiobacillus neapolitanus]